MSPEPLYAAAQAALERLAGPNAQLRPDQQAAIAALVQRRERVVVVQATGWGKSAVYWIATALLRERGAGPTVVVSPLLSLMRDQVAAAARMGLAAVTMNSSNLDDWPAVESALREGSVDVLLVSPERLNNPGFRERILPGLTAALGLLVIDEAHCISDWGHDFRPDYRRIKDVLTSLPAGVPVLATTATANARVTADIAEQLGPGTPLLRGSLDRPSLALAVLTLSDTAERYAWITELLPRLAGAGIIYALTVEGAERLAGHLRQQGLAVAAYTGRSEPELRERLEAALKAGELKALVATSALGMGFDHPQLSFVVHLGAPANAIAYYQQVGRAGRALDRAVAVVLPEPADAGIWDYFVDSAMPPSALVQEVLDVLAGAEEPLSVVQLERQVALRRGRLEALLKVLDVDGAVARVGSGWTRTRQPYSYDGARAAAVAAQRRVEQDRMREFLRAGRCLLQTVREELDDTADGPPEACGRCQVCLGHLPGGLVERPSEEAVQAALRFLRTQRVVLPARAMWPSGAVEGRRGRIAVEHRPHDGRALADAGDGAWEAAVRAALDADELSAELLEGAVAVLASWGWGTVDLPRPGWICPLPSRRHPGIVTALAEGLGRVGRLPVVPALVRDRETPWQETAPNAARAATWAGAALAVAPGVELPPGPPLLVDDVTHSGWTLMVAGVLLAEAGTPPALPFALLRAPALG